MSQTFSTSPQTPTTAPPRRVGQAVRRGLRGRCPACGEGRMFGAYLKVSPECPSCSEALHHHRADDFPAYVTILVVGHVLGAMFMAVNEFWPDLPTWVHYLIWPGLCIVLSLWLLPIFKGGLIAYQWALRMHGFESTPNGEADTSSLRPSAVA